MFRTLSPFIFFTLILSFCLHSFAEELATPAELNPLSAQADQLFETIHQQQAEIKQLSNDFEKSYGDEYIALERRLFQRKVELLSNISQLTQNIHLQQKSNTDSAKTDRIQLLPLLKDISPRIQNYTDRLESILSKQRIEYPTPDEKQRQVRKKTYQQLDTAYQALSDHIDNLELMGLDATTQRFFLVDRLTTRAEKLSGSVEFQAELKEQTLERIDAEPNNTDYKTSLVLTEEKLAEDIQNLSNCVNILQKMGKETSRYQQLLLRTTGNITTDIFDREVIRRLFQQWRDDFKNTLVNDGPSFLVKAGIFIFVLFIFHLLALLTGKIVQRSITASHFNISQLLQDMVVASASRMVFIVGILMALSQVGISLGPVLAGLGGRRFYYRFRTTRYAR